MPQNSTGTPFRTPHVPSYRLHKASGQAIVTLGGRDVYLGAHGSIESHKAYERSVAEWLAAGRPAGGVRTARDATMLVSELILRFWDQAKQEYPEQTLEGTVKPPLRRMRRLYGDTPVQDFGPLRLKALRQSMVDEELPGGRRLSRSYINRSIRWVRRVFRWGVEEELVDPMLLRALEAVGGLRAGRVAAPECEPVRPVSDEVVEQTLERLPPTLVAMVRLQRLTGMRPGEVCGLTTRGIDSTGELWVYEPREHKTAHHGKRRLIVLGPRARAILEPRLRPDLDAPVFSPRDAMAERSAELRLSNRTPMTPSRRRRDAERQARPKRGDGDRYTTASYARAIRRACEHAGIPHWTPNQLRHIRATELRRRFGLDAAGAVLGHARLETTQIYAERDLKLAETVARQTG